MADDEVKSPAGRFPFPKIQPRVILPESKRSDVLNIAIAPRGAEPEAAPVERVHAIGIQLTHGGQALTGKLSGATLPAAVSEDYGRAGTLAQNLLTRCAGCEHFDRNAAQPYIEAAVTKMKSAVVVDANGRARDVSGRQAAWQVLIDRESVLRASGLCRAISEVMKNHADGALRAPWLTHPDGGCPAPAQLRGPGGEDLSKLYKARERPAHGKTAGQTAYDRVLGVASGKKD